MFTTLCAMQYGHSGLCAMQYGHSGFRRSILWPFCRIWKVYGGFINPCCINTNTPLIHTSLYCRIKTHHIKRHSTHTLRNFKPQDYNYYPFSSYIDITYIILSNIIKIYNCYGTTSQLTTFVPLHSCNNVALKMATIAAETCW